jgi:phosphate transport system substrate-binding protein
VGTLGTANILVGDQWVPVSAQGAAKALDISPQLEGRHERDLAVNLNRTTTESGAYPLVLVSYAVVCLHYEDQQEAQFIQAFLTWVTSQEGQELAGIVAGSSPISATLRQDIVDSLAAITFGSAAVSAP